VDSPVDSAVLVTPGRSLRFAPEWPCSEASVIFDRNSGDYWVVSLLASGALKLLQKHGSMTITELGRSLGSSQPYSDINAALELMCQSLVANDMVQLEQLAVQSLMNESRVAN
jgi:hypothetical protein